MSIISVTGEIFLLKWFYDFFITSDNFIFDYSDFLPHSFHSGYKAYGSGYLYTVGFCLCCPSLPYSFCKGKYLAFHNFQHDYGGYLLFYKEDYKKQAWSCRCLVCIFSGTFFKTIFSAFLYFNSGSCCSYNWKQKIQKKIISIYSIYVSFSNNKLPASDFNLIKILHFF